MFTRVRAMLPGVPSLLLIAAAIVGVTNDAAAATFVVNSTLDAVDAMPGNGVCATVAGTCTLRAAVQEANALSGTHVITLPSGTYTLTLAGKGELNGATGDLNIRSTTSGAAQVKDITITGAGATTTIVDGNGIDRVFEATRSTFACPLCQLSLTLNDLTVTNGRAEGTTAISGFGGCLSMNYVQLTLARVVVTAWTASAGVGQGARGGGIAISGGQPHGSATLTVTDTVISQNVSHGIDASSAFGGGVAVVYGTAVTIARSTIAGNSAQYGGGLGVFGYTGSPTTVTVTDSTIAQNVSTTVGGGGLYGGGTGDAALTVANTTITDNVATTGSGGGILMGVFGGVTLANVTIAANSSATGGAVATNASSGPLSAKNTIIASNTGAAPANCAGAISGLGHNLEFPGTSCGFGLASDRRADPLLGPLSANGGPTETLELLSGSAAIDAGDDATCLAAPVSGLDQRGVSRVVGAGADCDIGAFESGGSSTGPFPPTALVVASVVGNLVTLRWAIPNAAGLTGFVLEGGVSPGQVLGSIVTGSLAPTFTFSAPSGSFYLRVHALYGAVKSGASNEILVHVNVTVAPSAPANLLGLANGSTLALAWTSTFAGGAPTNVTLNVSGALSGSVPLGPTDAFSFAGVPPGTYTFTATATNTGGSSPPSNPVTLTFPSPCGGAPQLVANFVAYHVGGTVFLSWDAPTTGTAPTGFVLDVTGSFVGSLPMPVKSLSGPVPPGTYTFTVAATNACGAGPATTPLTVVVP